MPRFSVIVPSFRRPDTLAVTLACLAECRHERLEVVVVDNAGDDQVADVLRRARTQLAFELARSDTPLPMMDSWELGLARATGDYVTVIGDDDALLPHAVPLAESCAAKAPFAILCWNPLEYYWPTAVGDGQDGRFRGWIGRGRTTLAASWFWSRWSADFSAFPLGPGIYQAWVARSLIDGVRTRFGRYFFDPIPDLCSAVANLFEAAQSGVGIDHLAMPLSLRGISHRSFGNAYLAGERGDTLRQSFEAVEAAPARPLVDPALAPATGLAAVVASAWLRILPRVARAYGMALTADLPTLAERVARQMAEAGAAEPARALLHRYGRPDVALPPAAPRGAPAAATGVVWDAAASRLDIDCRLGGLGVTDTFGALAYARTLLPAL